MMSKDSGTWLRISYVVLGALAAYIYFLALRGLGGYWGIFDRYPLGFMPGIKVLSLVLASGSLWLFTRCETRRRYHLDTIKEMGRMVWPSGEVVRRLTWVVGIVVAISALILAFFDLMWALILRWVLP